jgi:hypothetical protein
MRTSVLFERSAELDGSGAMRGLKLTQRVHTFLASLGLGAWLLGIGRCLRAEYRA